MFTGLVEDQGTLLGRTSRGPGARLRVQTALPDLVLGESISVEGVCLTVDALIEGGFEADASGETLERSTLGALPVPARLNLERATPLGGRMGGHIVSGHVDGVGKLAQRTPLGDAARLAFTFPPALAPFIAEKGSIAVDGISLTVNGVGEDAFHVVVIPRTLADTTLSNRSVGSKVNLEVDVLARYVLRLLQTGATNGSAPGANDAAWLEKLQRGGYM